ncbi:MAG: 23S rRNA (uracil(1939)-C(5))-methyltransferase RlmD, partial [Pseudohongiellaceae bacterium]
ARLQIPQIEVAAGETQQGLQVALIVRHLQALSAGDMEKLKAFAEQQQCDMYLQPGNPDSIHKIWPADSIQRLVYFLPDYHLEMLFHPIDFTQVNAEINRKIIPLAIELLAPHQDDRVLDLFCGLGNFTLPLARFCRAVTGIEGSEEMVQRARENALRNQISNVEFHTANLLESFAAAPWVGSGFNRVLLDPPRSGAQEIIPLIANLRPVRVVYISCNPATLARDAASFEISGYQLVKAGVMDMFPQTAHVESIAVFEPAHGRTRK